MISRVSGCAQVLHTDVVCAIELAGRVDDLGLDDIVVDSVQAERIDERTSALACIHRVQVFGTDGLLDDARRASALREILGRA